ncbi:MAG: PAS domain-containing protein [Microcoleaceae cyanobacterium]
MAELIATLFSSGSFIPHGHCYLWRPGLVWLHLLSDSVIALAYYSIPLTLLYFVQKRKDLPFNWIFLLFGAFIVSCGTMHLMEVWTLWHPTYWLSGTIKAITAIISLYTAIVLVKLMPQVLALPSPTQLATINQELQQQIRDRQQAEAEVRQLNQELEARVARRTAELERSIAQAQHYAERISLAMDAAQMGSWDWDLEHQNIIWSTYHEILLSYEPGTPERTYEDWARRVHPDDLAATEAAVQNAIATGTDYSAEYRVIWEDGSVHWVAGFGRFYANSAGEPFRMVGMLQDITDRKQIEELLQLSEERLRLATEAADIGMWFWNLVEDKLVWTARCKTLFGLDPETEMSYERFMAALHPDDRDRTHIAATRTVTDHVEYDIEYRSIWPDETVHWILAKGRAFYDEQGKPIRMMGMAQDITARKQAEVNLQERTQELSQMNRLLLHTTTLLNQRNQELDQFAHIVSHDLKAPLRAIANLSEWLEDDLADQASPDIKQNLELLRSRVYRMEALINGLLAYARISYREAPCETFSLKELLEEIVNSLDIPPEFTVQFPPDPPILTTSRLLLSQVLTNLIGNAVKHHNRPDGRVQIMVHALDQAQGYEFIISDDGPGIASKNYSRVFDIFQTLTSRDQTESTGIGLAIVKKIIEQTGGQIHLESQLEQGATFRFTWVLAPQVSSTT